MFYFNKYFVCCCIHRSVYTHSMREVLVLITFNFIVLFFHMMTIRGMHLNVH